MRNDFCIFILTHGRPDSVYTISALKKLNYTGRIILVIDNEDDTAERYYENYGRENVYMFDKTQKAKEIDGMDQSEDHRAIVYARCACYDIAKNLGFDYFLELDDDFDSFRARIPMGDQLLSSYITSFDKLVDIMIEFLNTSNADTVAFAQCGDFIGGVGSMVCRKRLVRKAMNAFFCKTSKPIVWSGRMNEDVTAYVTLGSRGRLFFTIADIALNQLSTQSLSGGMSDVYSGAGTYIKSFYSVMSAPSCVKVHVIGPVHKRIHHVIDWEHAVPKIISSRFQIKEEKR